MRRFLVSLLLAACLILPCVHSTLAAIQANPAALEEPGKNCVKQYNEVNDGTGLIDRCCINWRVATCFVNTASSLLRESSRKASAVHMTQAGCDKYVNQIGESMPAACYWKYRTWVPVTGIVVAVLVLVGIIAGIIVIIGKRRRHAALRDAERT